MSGCKRACAIALRSPGRYTYLFGDLPPTDAAARSILDCAHLYASREDGFMRREERPEALRAGILARIPP